MARDQRTRLNAELANQFGAAARARKVPGRSALTDGIAPAQEDELELDAEVEHDVEASAEEPAVATEPKKSIFELPRKQAASPTPSLSPSPSSSASVPAASAPTPFGKPRRG